MKAIHFDAPGKPEVMKPINVKKPSPSEGQVLIKVKAAGVNRPDLMQREGNYPAPEGHSKILGLEVSGEIEDIGENVYNYNNGDEVCALVNGGGYAEYCVADVGSIIKKPKNLNFIEAAAIPECFFTCWSNLFDRGKIAKNQSVLIHGGSSGIGTTAIQMLKVFDIFSFVTVGSERKKNLCKNLGADVAINYNKEDFFLKIKETKKRGVNVILDMVGGDYVQKNINLLCSDGKLINIAYQMGSKVQIDLIKVMLKRLIITGSTLRIRDSVFKKNIRDSLIKNIVPSIENGKIKPIIDSVFFFEESFKAHETMYKSEHFGKIVLDMENK